MPYSLTTALCQIQGAGLAQRLYGFLVEHDSVSFHDDDDMLQMVQDWQCQTTVQLANRVNEMMVENTKAYFECCLVAHDNRKHIQPMLHYDEHYDENRPELSHFHISFDGFKYLNPDKKVLSDLSDMVLLYEKILKRQVYPQFFYCFYVTNELIKQICAIDKTITTIPYNPQQTDAYVINLVKNNHYDEIMRVLAAFNSVWVDEIAFRRPSFILLIDSQDDALPVW